jgi:hypothetical protein
MQDDTNHYFAWNWTHVWVNNTVNDQYSSPDKYIFGLPFDFDHDHIWQDKDNNVYTIDDTLGLAYQAYTVGSANETGWIHIYIPKGGYAYSWNATTNQLQPIAGPPEANIQGPGALDPHPPYNPVTFDFGAGRSPEGTESNVTYTYTLELAVPNVLFHSTADYGFGLVQETNFVKDGTQYNETYGWSWPTEWTGYYFTGNDPYYPKYFGILTDFIPPVEAVGGFIAEPTDDILLVAGDIAINPHGTKPLGVYFQQGRDTTPLGFVSGMLVNPQPSIFDTNSTWINQTSGRPFGWIPSDVIFAVGGPDINAVAHYYEHTDVGADRAPVTWSEEGSDVIWRYPNGTVVANVTQASTNVPPGTSDVFAIQILRDADNRLVVLMYGERYTGTWAAAWYFKFVMYPNMSNYTNSYYIVRWTDAASGRGSNYTPDLGDTYTIIAQG